MAAFTYTKPVVGGSEDAWGDTLNANWDALGAFIGPLDSTELAMLDGVTSAIQTQIDGKQPLDADLTAVAGLATSGLVARTGDGTAAARSIAVSGLATITDGDAVAGNPTVGVPAASQAEAEAGTDNTKVMTPLRVGQAVAANVAYGAGNAALSVGAIGTYALLNYNSSSPPILSAGDTTAGSNLRYAGAVTANYSGTSGPTANASGTPAGTWRIMGRLDMIGGVQVNNASLYLRIS